MMKHLSRNIAQGLRSLILAFGASIALIAPASAQSGPVFDRPIYSPDAKSYFELVAVKPEEARLSHRGAEEIRWEVASSLAAGRTFKGVKGRLAGVSSLKVHQFLMENFRPSYPAWIGAAYYCKSRELRWSDGHHQAKGNFQAWHPQWDQAGNAGCMHGGGEANYMPIAYSGAPEGFRWMAKGAFKEYTCYFVEYPTGKP
jgi:hypothetical protein